MRLKQFELGPRYWGIWDDERDTWHEGDHDDAYHAAGVPYWLRERDAQRALDRLVAAA